VRDNLPPSCEGLVSWPVSEHLEADAALARVFPGYRCLGRLFLQRWTNVLPEFDCHYFVELFHAAGFKWAYDFDLPALLGMFGELDAESVPLLESYLDRRFPAWRQNAQGNTAGGQSRPSSSDKMTDEEAYQILGLQPGAGRDEISRAHRALMKKLHPDQGGSTYLATRVNEAKDTLLRTHHS